MHAPIALLQLRVKADPDSGAIARVLERFQNLNVLPRRVVAEYGSTGAFHIQVDITGVSESMLTIIAAKIAQSPCIIEARWNHA